MPFFEFLKRTHPVELDKKRFVVLKESKELISLIEQHPYIVDRHSSLRFNFPTLCGNIEINFIRSLLLMLKHKEYYIFFRDNLAFRPQRLVNLTGLKAGASHRSCA